MISKKLNVLLWLFQIILAGVFGSAGMLKLIAPINSLAAQMTWVNLIPEYFTRTIGFLELMSGIGLVLPVALSILPRTTGYTALALLALMICASAMHTVIGEFDMVPINLILGSIAAIVAWGRLKKINQPNSAHA